MMPERKKKTKRSYSLPGSTSLTVQWGGSSKAVFGYLTELRKHRFGLREGLLVGSSGAELQRGRNCEKRKRFRNLLERLF